MKKSYFLTALLVCFCAVFMQAQLKINSNGKMYLGPVWNEQDLNNVLTGSVFGPNGTYKGGSKLAFGDFGRREYSGWNVFIGEYPDANMELNGESDQLWLHGKNGIYLTKNGQATSIIMYVPSVLSNDIYFTSNIFSESSLISSDIRFKSNIENIEKPLDKLLALQGVTYDYNDKERMDALAKRQGEVISEHSDEPPSEKELQAMEEMNLWEEMQLQKEHKIGFIAQEVQKVLPELVKEDDLGYLAVDYVSMVPIMVEAMKEQQRKIQELEARLAQLEKNGNQKSSPTGIEETENNTTNTFLYQNVPNPFTERTEIRYFLPEESRNAQLYIFNMRGQNVKTVSLSGNGTGTIIIQGAELAPGTYIYMLYSNGKELDTQRMVLTK